MSGLILIQTVTHSDGIPEIFFWKVYFEKSQQMTKINTNYPDCKESICPYIINTPDRGQSKMLLAIDECAK